MNPEHGELFLFRVFTSKGRFHIWVEADTWEEAEALVSGLFVELWGMTVTEIRRARHETGESDETSTLLRARDSDLSTDEPWRGMRLLAGKKLWVALGVGHMYEAELIVARAQLESQ